LVSACWLTHQSRHQRKSCLTNNAALHLFLATGFAPGLVCVSISMDGQFNTGSLRHALAVGSSGMFNSSPTSRTRPRQRATGIGSIANPVSCPVAGLPPHDKLFISSAVHQQGFNVADTVAR
jgi:hypothetical protein